MMFRHGSGLLGREHADPRPRRMRRDPVVWAFVVLAIVELAVVAWWLIRPGGSLDADRFTGFVSAPTDLLAIFLAFRVAGTRHLETRARQAWALFGIAFCIYFVGVYLQILATALPDSPLLGYGATVLVMAAYVTAGVGLSRLPKAPRTKADEILFGMDLCIVSWSATMLLWHFFISPVAVEAGSSLVATANAAVFPVADLAFVFGAIAVVVRGVGPGSRSSLILMALALLALFGADLEAGVETLKGTYVPGDLTGTLDSASAAFLVLGCYLQLRSAAGTPGTPNRPVKSYSFGWLSYVLVVVAFVAPTVRDWDNADLLRQHLPASGVLMALVVARLWVTAWKSAGLAAVERERLATAVDQAAEAMLMTDQDGNVTYANPALTRITGFAASELLGKPPASLRRDASSAERVAELAASLERGEAWEGRLHYRCKNGTVVEMDLAVSPLRDGSGAIVGTVEIARDVTRERALEAQLAQAQKMEAVGRLAGGIAHDFNNILTAISGFGELAASGVDSDHPVASDIAEIRKAAGRASTLTTALLAFSRRQVMQPKVLDLNDVVSSIFPMLERLIGEDVELVLRPDSSLGRTLIDRGQFEQVVMNLVVNARDAMPDGGTLVIETANSELDARHIRAHLGSNPGPHVMLAVSDTGVGMKPEVMEHAFEPFYTTKALGKGTGLGLSTVIGIVQQSGGFIHVDTEPGLGTTFRIYLPRVDTPSEPEEPALHAGRSPRGSETVLIAEDEGAVRLFVERILADAGYRVFTSPNGQAALELAGTLSHIDLLFTDMIMPGMRGPELAKLLLESHPGVRVLYASGYTDDKTPLGDGSAAPFQYLAKPFTADALRSCVRQTLDRPPAS